MVAAGTSATTRRAGEPSQPNDNSYWSGPSKGGLRYNDRLRETKTRITPRHLSLAIGPRNVQPKIQVHVAYNCYAMIPDRYFKPDVRCGCRVVCDERRPALRQGFSTASPHVENVG